MPLTQELNSDQIREAIVDYINKDGFIIEGRVEIIIKQLTPDSGATILRTAADCATYAVSAKAQVKKKTPASMRFEYAHLD